MDKFYENMLLILRDADKERKAFKVEYKKIQDKGCGIKNGLIGFGIGIVFSLAILYNIEYVIEALRYIAELKD